MTLHQLRETIQQTGSTTSGVIQFQKRINLEPGQRHSIKTIDFFDDGLLGSSQNNTVLGYQVYVTNYPVILTDNIFHVAPFASGPLAGDDLVLFKASMLSIGPTAASTPAYLVQQFPDKQNASQSTFDFYTPTLYFTVVFANANDLTFDANIAMSIYLEIESVDCNSVEYGIGMLQEHNNNQAIEFRSNGIQIDKAQIIRGQPMWTIGGIRPEIVSSNNINIAGQQWFYSQAGYGEGEEVSDTSDIRKGLKLARQMVSDVSAFGTAIEGIPDWFKAIAKPFPGLESGPVRQQQPPLKHFDNGNVMML